MSKASGGRPIGRLGMCSLFGGEPFTLSLKMHARWVSALPSFRYVSSTYGATRTLWQGQGGGLKTCQIIAIVVGMGLPWDWDLPIVTLRIRGLW
jgi:hypothetical protein